MTRGSLLRSLATSGLATACLAAVAVAQEGALPNATAAESVRGLQQRLLADPQMAEKVQALREDPTVQAILDDPDLAAALARGDIAALLADPKIQRLADDPAVRELGRSLGP
jgi:hypothetical protein